VQGQLNIKSSKLDNYKICFFSNWNQICSSFLVSFIKKNQYESVFILVDNKIKDKHLDLLLSLLKKSNITVNFLSIVSSEQRKTLGTCQLVYKKMLSLNLGRKTLFINFGGGVISDLGGFVASTYKRGIDFINLPTSLLAMVDASIGGKLGIDYLENKNAIGLFANPKLVLINLEFLKTLPKRELLNGWAEMIKHGLIDDRVFFDLILSKKPTDFTKQELIKDIQWSCEIKYKYVCNDEYDLKERQLLNFGHTVGHALESYFLSSKTKLKHGEAVLWGMLIESRISNLMEVLLDQDYELIKDRIESFGLRKINLEKLDFNKLQSFLFNDKKNQQSKIIFNLIRKIGQIEYGQTLDLSILKKALKNLKLKKYDEN